MSTVCRRCRVTGRVQGVFYRASTQQQARALGVTGWVRNLPDGSVEILACGTPESVDALGRWLWDGPRLAEVEGVECTDEPVQVLSDFTTE